MSKSLLYHGFGIRGYEYQRTTYEEGTVIFHIRQQRESLRCPQCGSDDVQRRGHVVRPFQHLPIASKPVFVEMPVARVACRRPPLGTLPTDSEEKAVRTPPLVARMLALSAAASLGISIWPTAGAQVIPRPPGATARKTASLFVPPRFEAPPAHLCLPKIQSRPAMMPPYPISPDSATPLARSPRR